MKIWKYTMDHPTESFTIPELAQLLSVQPQNGNPTLWFEVYPAAPMQKRTFTCVPTGGDIPESGRYCGTVQQSGFGLVWHVYEVTP